MIIFRKNIFKRFNEFSSVVLNDNSEVSTQDDCNKSSEEEEIGNIDLKREAENDELVVPIKILRVHHSTGSYVGGIDVSVNSRHNIRDPDALPKSKINQYVVEDHRRVSSAIVSDSKKKY